MKRPRIGLALGSGSARGWSHIGVIRALEEAGLAPDMVCGTSIGAVVGAAYADGQLDRLETWVKTLTWQSVVALLDLKLDGGLIEGKRLLEFFRAEFHDKDIAALGKPYAAVATELLSGREVWLREGSVLDAARASMALPGLFSPKWHGGRLLVDGGLVNPVPVSLCRAMGADLVIAVDLNWDLLNRHALAARDEEPPPPAGDAAPLAGPFASLLGMLPASLGQLRSSASPANPLPPMADVLSMSLNIMQLRITRSRLAGDPADVMIRPRLASLALMDFHQAETAIAEGRRAAERALPYLRETLGTT